jgi:glutathione S-transferase
MAPNYKLVYFDFRGKGEPLRWIFAYAGVKFDDHRINYQDWPSLKASLPFPLLPYLEVDGKLLPQSGAIARYLAKQYGLAGKNDWEAAEADAVVGCTDDAFSGARAWFQEKDEKKKAAMQSNFCNEVLPPYLQGLERKLKENSNGQNYLVGGSPTWADFVVGSALEGLTISMDKALLDKYPLLKAHNQRIRELKGIKEWIAKRPNTPM